MGMYNTYTNAIAKGLDLGEIEAMSCMKESKGSMLP